MNNTAFRSVLVCLMPALGWCAFDAADGLAHHGRPAPRVQEPEEVEAIQIQYLEIVTPEVDATCATLAERHGVSFGKPDAGLGNARTAALKGGGMIGVRAPMHDAEQPVVRPYWLVDDIDAATKAAKAAGGEIMLPPMQSPGRGKFSIYMHGGIEHGLWQM